jgi:8-oxo-dGTP pyrophosphatase MutT (NUDIX family)
MIKVFSEDKLISFADKDSDKLFAQFKAKFRYIEAAGGLVKNNKGEYLFIFRNGKWDLPKGKLEKGETIKKCAKREVEEECGIKGLKIVKELPSTFHTYYMEEKPVLKRTYWFEMESDDVTSLIPQTEEGITEVKWVKKKDFAMVMKNTYPSIIDVIDSIVKKP